MKNLSNVEQKCISINTLYEFAQKTVDVEINHLSQFIGKDVFKNDGRLKERYKGERVSFKGQLLNGVFYNVDSWIELSYSKVWLHVKSCVSGGTYDNNTAFCIYDKLMTQLFSYEDNKLIPVEVDRNYMGVRYNVEDLQKIANEIEIAAKEYKSKYDKMPYQFKDVFWIERLSR